MTREQKREYKAIVKSRRTKNNNKKEILENILYYFENTYALVSLTIIFTIIIYATVNINSLLIVALIIIATFMGALYLGIYLYEKLSDYYYRLLREIESIEINTTYIEYDTSLWD